MRKYLVCYILFSCLQIATRGQTLTDVVDLSGLPQPTTAESLQYWFDDDFVNAHITGLQPEQQMLDVSQLSDGLHVIHYQVICNNGQISPSVSYIFLKVSTGTESSVNKSLRYWFDEDQISEEVNNYEGIQLLDASHLTEGVHTIHYQIANSRGTLGSPYSSMFLKIDREMDSASANCIRYWFDNDTCTLRITEIGNGIQTLEVDDIPKGLHTLNYQLINNSGVVGVPVSSIFMKSFDHIIEGGQNRITKYEYWLNDHTSEMTAVTLNEPVNPFSLVSLLPMQQEPIRSSCFHFEIVDGKPMMYAKNDFHVRFYDAANYWGDDSRQFVDYSVSREVEPVGALQASQTFNKVAEDDVRWYTIGVSKGDYMEFKTDIACTIQIFSPSGEKVYEASGYDVMKWGGCHADKNGLYYLAVHDVAAQQGSSIRVDYNLTNKYAVLHHTPGVVGNAKGSCFTMHLSGNGFDKLVNATLKQGDQIINKSSFLDISIFNADIRFNIVSEDCNLGKYDLILSFVDEDGKDDVLVVKDIIEIEEAIYADIKVEMTNKSNIRPYPLSVSIKNEGNMSYSYIPLNIAWDKPQEASNVTFKNFYATVAESNDSAGYQFIVYTDNLLDKGVDGAVMFFYIPELGPYETMELQLGFSAPANLHFNIYAWTGTPLELDTLTLKAQPNRARKKANTSHIGSNIVSFGDNLENITGSRNMPDVVQNAGQAVNNAIKIGATIGSMQNAMGRSLGREQIEAYGGNWEDYVDIYEQLYPEVLTPGQIIGDDAGEAVDQLMNNQRQCARNSQPEPNSPHHGHIAVPSDPNDIFGYLSDAGSKFIADSVAKVNYTIEFENDTTFATAAAHTIVIKDTLDNQYFDFAKFMPTGIRIGEHEMFLDENDIVYNNGKTSFVKTIDMRPAINTIAQVDGTFNQTTGIAEWRFTSLDPMTMEPTDELMQGILPVNYDGSSGIGEVMFDIGVKQGKTDGAEISNKASIVFDYEKPILTPTWTNIVDAVAPNSCINDLIMLNDSTIHLTAEGVDERSGVWKYTWYVQAGKNAPWWKEGETEIPSFDYHIYEDIDYGFCVLATDSAGNVEKKVIERERGFITTANRGDANGNGEVEIGDVTSVLTLMATPEATGYDNKAADANQNGEIEIGDVTTILTIMARGE